MASIAEFFMGKPEQFQQIQRYNPQQQQAFSSILQQALSGLQPQQFGQRFEPIAQEARGQFAENIVPSLAERFTALDGQRSSAFTQQLGQAGAGLERGLAAQKAQFGLQEIGPLIQLLSMGLTPQFDTVYRPGTQGLLGGLAGGLGQGIGSVLPLLLKLLSGGL